MTSSKCPKCSLVQWADGETCKRCGAPFVAAPQTYSYVPTNTQSYESQSYSAQPYQYQSYQSQPYQPQSYQPQPYQPQPYQQQTYVVGQNAQLKTGLALTSMVLAIVSFPMTFLLIGLLIAPVAIILGIVAVRKATKQPHEYGGKGFAIAGIAVGSVICVFFVPLIAAIAIPNLLAARRAANEGSAVKSLQTLANAQMTYASTTGAGITCGDVSDLYKANLIDSELGTGRKHGYRFTATGSWRDTNGCEVQATPQTKSEGTRSFYYSSTDGIIRASTDGLPADHDDKPMDLNRVSR